MSPWLPSSQLPLKTSVSSIAQFRFHPFADSFPHSAVWGGGLVGEVPAYPHLTQRDEDPVLCKVRSVIMCCDKQNSSPNFLCYDCCVTGKFM